MKETNQMIEKIIKRNKRFQRKDEDDDSGDESLASPFREHGKLHVLIPQPDTSPVVSPQKSKGRTSVIAINTVTLATLPFGKSGPVRSRPPVSLDSSLSIKIALAVSPGAITIF